MTQIPAHAMPNQPGDEKLVRPEDGPDSPQMGELFGRPRMALDPTQAALSTLALVPTIVQESGGEATKAQAALEKLRGLTVYTAEHIAIAGDLLQYIKGDWTRLENRRTSITKPLLAVKRSIDDLFNPAIHALAEAETILKSKIAQAQLAIQQANYAAQQAAHALLQQNDARGAALASQHLQTTEAPKGIRYTDVWEYRIVNAAIIPLAFLMADEKKIAAHVKIHGANSNIPGVEVTKNIGIAAGRK